MFKKKNTVVPECKIKEMKRSEAEDDLTKFFKTRIRVETNTATYFANFYVAPRERQKCCKIL